MGVFSYIKPQQQNENWCYVTPAKKCALSVVLFVGWHAECKSDSANAANHIACNPADGNVN